MVELGFARDEVVDLADFLAIIIARYGKSAFIHFHWGNALSASVTDGTNTVRINGGFLLLSVSGNFPNLAWGMATAIYCSGAHYEGGTPIIWKFVETVESTAGTIASKNIYRYSGQTTAVIPITALASGGAAAMPRGSCP